MKKWAPRFTFLLNRTPILKNMYRRSLSLALLGQAMDNRTYRLLLCTYCGAHSKICRSEPLVGGHSEWPSGSAPLGTGADRLRPRSGLSEAANEPDSLVVGYPILVPAELGETVWEHGVSEEDIFLPRAEHSGLVLDSFCDEGCVSTCVFVVSKLMISAWTSATGASSGQQLRSRSPAESTRTFKRSRPLRACKTSSSRWPWSMNERGA